MRGAALAANWRPLLPRPGANRDAEGHALVTSNGHARDRLVPTVARAGALRVSDRRVEERTGETRKFSSRTSHPLSSVPEKSGVLPLLSLHGLSTGDFAPALEAVVGSSVGLSSVITRRRRSDRTRPGVLGRDLRDVDSVESSADQVRVPPPGKDASLCLVVVGVRLDPRRARPDHRRRPGVDRLSGQSLLGPVSLRLRHGGERAPVVAVGDGAAGFPLRSSTSSPRPSRLRDQRALLPPRRCAHPHPPSRGRSGRRRRARPPTSVTRRRDHALAAATAVEVDRPTWPKVADTLRSDLDRLRASPRTRLPTGFTCRPRPRSSRASRRCLSGPG